MPSQAARALHFWSPNVIPEAAKTWDPDAEPALFADGFGHNMLELYARMRRLGLEVSVGPAVPPGARVVVFLPSLLDRRAQLTLMRELMPRGRIELVSIRSDFLTNYQLPVMPSLEVMPNKSSLVAGNQAWIPPLPQRGLIPRSSSRGHSVQRLTYKGYAENLPADARTHTWTQRLADLGVEWIPDVLDETSGRNNWHDFSQVDLALCLRADGIGLIRKPATKLINAWCAGVIPLVGREPGYLELVKHREDAMIVDGPDDVLTTLAHLQADPTLVKTLLEGGKKQSRGFEVGPVMDAWVQALTGPLPTVSTVALRTTVSVVRVGARVIVDAARGNRRSLLWSPPV